MVCYFLASLFIDVRSFSRMEKFSEAPIRFFVKIIFALWMVVKSMLFLSNFSTFLVRPCWLIIVFLFLRFTTGTWSLIG